MIEYITFAIFWGLVAWYLTGISDIRDMWDTRALVSLGVALIWPLPVTVALIYLMYCFALMIFYD